MTDNKNITADTPIGTVLKIFVQDTVPPKVKFLVVVGINETTKTLATIFINSELRPRNLGSEVLQALQFSLQPSTCLFLQHESFADCSEIRERSISEIAALIKKDSKRKVAILGKSQLDEILVLLKKSKSISVSLKKKYNLTF